MNLIIAHDASGSLKRISEGLKFLRSPRGQMELFFHVPTDHELLTDRQAVWSAMRARRLGANDAHRVLWNKASS